MNIKEARFLLAGSAGQLGREFQNILSERELCFFAPPEDQLNITNFDQVKAVVAKVKPDIFINCAAYNVVDKAEDETEIAFAVNGVAVEHMAQICKANGIFFVHYSSDYVFNGKKGDPYAETDEPDPINAYGKSKLEGEQRIAETGGDYLIFRLSWVYGSGKQNFLYKLRQWVKTKGELNVASDERSVPTYTRDIAEMTLRALAADLKGLYHLVNSGSASRYELAQYYLNRCGFKVKVNPVKQGSFKTRAKRPGCSAMSNQKLINDLGDVIPTWQNALDRFVDFEKVEMVI